MNILWITLFTVKDILRSKVLVGVVFIAMLIAFFSLLASEFTFGVPARIALDIGLGGMSISNVAISLFFGVTLLTKEIDSRTIYISLVRPITRWEFLLAKILGLLIVIAINTSVLSLFSLAVFWTLGGIMTTILWWTIFFIFLEASLLLIVVIFFSMFTNTTISVLCGLATYLVGQTLSTILESHFVQNTIWKPILLVAVRIIPDFDKLNIKPYLLYKQYLSSTFIFNTTFYCLSYMCLLLLIILLLFNKKELT